MSPQRPELTDGIFCHEHEVWECRHIDGLEDKSPHRILIMCHNQTGKKKPWCTEHKA